MSDIGFLVATYDVLLMKAVRLLWAMCPVFPEILDSQASLVCLAKWA